tara:strand:+ start:1220 stop:1384 length:165 start_codon:yes stop_codon:yes gene_type:complete
MAVVSRNERKKRRCDALARLTSGMGVSQVTESLVRTTKSLEEVQIWILVGQALR